MQIYFADVYALSDLCMHLRVCLRLSVSVILTRELFQTKGVQFVGYSVYYREYWEYSIGVVNINLKRIANYRLVLSDTGFI